MHNPAKYGKIAILTTAIVSTATPNFELGPS
jgi:hypothetical protein